MRKPDDSSLPPNRYLAVQKEAVRALTTADAFGVFPTPVNQVMEAAKVTVATENIFNEGLIQKFRKKLGGTLKRALTKVLGILDIGSRIIYIDKSLLIVKQTFLKLHETAHSILPWQRTLYSAIEDCELTIKPDIADEFDREANAFATEVLFQCGTFKTEAADHSFNIKTPLQLSKKYGASIYSTIRRYVKTHHRACAVLVLNKPELVEGPGFISSLRRVEVSDEFVRIMGPIHWPEQFSPDDTIGSIIPIAGRKMSRPRPIVLKDANGNEHECIAEAFTQTYQVFVLICHSESLSRRSFLVGF